MPAPVPGACARTGTILVMSAPVLASGPLGAAPVVDGGAMP